MSSHEIERFLSAWEFESKLTVNLLNTLPKDQYDFRPDPGGRSLGELAWHLAEIEGIMTTIAVKRDFGAPMPAGLERPRTVPELATGYERIHREAVERVRAIRPEDLDRTFPFFGGQSISVRHVLWTPLLHHLIHHRGQLMMMIRMAQGVPSRIYGPMREDDAAMRAKAQGR
ncbi:MAG: DinB family protein [Candidatus Eiseniibacteriota bacterium]